MAFNPRRKILGRTHVQNYANRQARFSAVREINTKRSFHGELPDFNEINLKTAIDNNKWILVDLGIIIGVIVTIAILIFQNIG